METDALKRYIVSGVVELAERPFDVKNKVHVYLYLYLWHRIPFISFFQYF